MQKTANVAVTELVLHDIHTSPWSMKIVYAVELSFANPPVRTLFFTERKV